MATTDNPHTTCGQDHCVFTVTNAALFLIMTHDRSPFVIPHDIRTWFVRRLRGVSAHVSSDGWYDALFSHLFWHVLDRRVALIFWLFIITFSSYITTGRTFIRGILTSFYGFFEYKVSIGLHNTLRPQRDFSSMCLWPVLSVLYSSPQLESFIFSHGMARFYSAELCSLVNLVSLNCTLTMNPMDAQRYDLSMRSSPAYEENGVSGSAASRSEIPPVSHDASLIEDPPSLVPTAHTAIKHTPLHSQQCDALAVPLPLSPILSPLRNGFMEDTSPFSDTLNKDTLINFPTSSDDDFKMRQLPEISLPSLVAPSPRVSHTSRRRPLRPLFHQDDGPEIIFSRPASPSPISPPLSPQSRPTSPHFWKSACSSPLGWLAAPLSPSNCRFNSPTSGRWDSMSCPTSPILRPSRPLPTPTSPTARHAMFSTVSHQLRALSSTSSLISPDLSRPTSPTSPILQAFDFDKWMPDRDPTMDIEVIEIMVTKEISVRVEEVVAPQITSTGQE